MRHIEVAAGIVWRGGAFLAAQRPDGKPMAGYWEFPGGKVEGAERPDQALRRELAEELGIGVRQAALWRTVERCYAERDLLVRLHFFHVTAFSGEPCPAEGQNLRWISPAEAPRLDFLPADAGLLAQLARMSPPEAGTADPGK